MRRKRTAALAGVMFYLNEEQEYENKMQMQGTSFCGTAPWKFYSRSTAAHMRSIVQSGKFQLNSMTKCPFRGGHMLQRAKYLTMRNCRTVSLAARKRKQPGTCRIT